MSKITFRADEDLDGWFEDYVEGLGISKSEFLRSHLISLKEDPLYREFNEAYHEDDRSLQEYVESSDEFNSKWVNTDGVDYEKLLGSFKEISRLAQKGEYEEAYNKIGHLEMQEDCEAEAILLESVVRAYKE